jgi:hypothetical protein
MTIEFLEDILCTPTLLPSEHRASSQLLRMLTKDESERDGSAACKGLVVGVENLKNLLAGGQV